MRKKRRRLWIILFIFVALLIGSLATGWNVVLVRDYQHFVALAKVVSLSGEKGIPPASLILRMILGTLGFIATLAISVLIFIKLLNEMRLNQQQSEFLDTVSHELKTPIATIELSSSLIRAGGLTDEEVNRLWDSHQNELSRLRDEVNALLEAARWQAKAPTHQKSPVALEHWIERSWVRWKAVLGPHSILTREGTPLDLHAFADPHALDLIMDNLISNARKFSRAQPRVLIRTLRLPKNRWNAHSRWQIQIQDHGWGFNPQDSHKIFYRFFRSRNQTPYAIPGTGLGLYLASSASRAMGLTLTGESQGTGQGATFILEGPEYLL